MNRTVSTPPQAAAREPSRPSKPAQPLSSPSALAMLGVLLPGAIGLLVIARTLLFYMGQDAGAALLVVAMGAALVVGLAELLLRTRRALGLSAEIRALPATPSEEDIAAQGPLLRDLLRARIENATLSRSESLTPYLVGLLVMLGLLGTLLGLFETLGGAGHALTASSNVDALRSGLSGPMRGLTRSFGCSAAGVSASAMLGLAAALVKRREASVIGQLNSYASRALREFSPLRSQANALAQLAAQGSALPQAASALESVAQQLSGLAERWEAAHRAAAEAQQKSLEGALSGLRAEMTKSATAASRELESALSRQLTQMVKTTGDLIAGHLQQTAQTLEQELGARRKDDVALRQGLAADLVSVRDGVAESTRAHSELIAGQVRGLEQALSARATHQSEQLESQRKQAEVHLAGLAEASHALVERLDEDARSRRDESGRLFDALAQRLDHAGSNLGQIASQVGTQLTTRIQSEHSLAERLGAAMALFEGSGKALDVALSRQEQAVEALLSQAREQLGQTREAAQLGLSEALEAAQRGHLQTTETVQQALLQTAESAQRSMAETSALAQLGLTQALEATQQGLAQTTEAAQHGAHAALQRVVDLAGEQAERLVQLERQLEGAQAGHAQGLSQQLGAQAERLGQGLETTTALVQQAAELLKASSVEMAAVAEMFAASVERQREAASSWLESLGELEGAVERAGRGAAADALGDQLASTQEVFARQLQFQRELFEQLRTLRSHPTPTPRGEHDVSA
jgi:hypothetical protein